MKSLLAQLDRIAAARDAVKAARQVLSEAVEAERKAVEAQQAETLAAEEEMRIILHNSGGTTNPDPSPSAITTLRLTSPSGGTKPYTVAQFFADGDAPQYVAVPGAQVTVMTRWDSGCVKTAVLAGMATLLAGVPSVLQLSTSAVPTPGTNVDTTDLASVTVGVTGPGGSVTFSGADWDAGEAWIEGPVMSSWIYSKVIIGTLVAWLEVRVYASGDIDIFPWVENGDMLSADQASKSGTFTFSINGVERCNVAIDLPARCRTPLINGTAFTYWVGTDPQVTPKHNTDYLMSTGLVPRYSGRPSDARVAQLVPTTYTPLQRGTFPVSMGNVGYHGSIGMLPDWDVLYLTNQGDLAYEGVVRNGFSAGRYQIHFRHEGRMVRPVDHPYLSDNSSSKNIETPPEVGLQWHDKSWFEWKISHHPSVGFMAHLVTGRWYFVDQLHQAVGYHYLRAVDIERGYSLGHYRTDKSPYSTRGAAWCLRTLAQALCITPTTDPRHSDLATLLSNNGDYYHAKYVAGDHNDFGFLHPYSDSGTATFWASSSWMNDFFVAALGYMKSMGVGSVKWTEVFHWAAQSIVNRFGMEDGHLYRDAGVYDIAMAPIINGVKPNWTSGAGPWYGSWADVWRDTRIQNGTTSYVKEIGDGTLRGTSAASPTSATGYWANLHPALAYAVDHGVIGAAAAYALLTGAPNYTHIADGYNGSGGFNTSPVWSVIPR